MVAVAISADLLSNRSGEIIQSGTGALSIGATLSLDNTGGAIASNGDAALSPGDLANQGGVMQAAGSLTVSATGALDNSAQGGCGLS